MPFGKAGNQVYLLVFVNFLAPGSGSRRAKSMRIRIRNTAHNYMSPKCRKGLRNSPQGKEQEGERRGSQRHQWWRQGRWMTGPSWIWRRHPPPAILTKEKKIPQGNVNKCNSCVTAVNLDKFDSRGLTSSGKKWLCKAFLCIYGVNLGRKHIKMDIALCPFLCTNNFTLSSSFWVFFLWSLLGAQGDDLTLQTICYKGYNEATRWRSTSSVWL